MKADGAAESTVILQRSLGADWFFLGGGGGDPAFWPKAKGLQRPRAPSAPRPLPLQTTRFGQGKAPVMTRQVRADRSLPGHSSAAQVPDTELGTRRAEP